MISYHCWEKFPPWLKTPSPVTFHFSLGNTIPFSPIPLDVKGAHPCPYLATANWFRMARDSSQENWSQGDPVLGLCGRRTGEKEALFSGGPGNVNMTKCPSLRCCMFHWSHFEKHARVSLIWTLNLNPTNVDSNTNPQGGF